jgi:hypothetical protein
MPMKENSESEQLFASLPKFIQGLTTFPVMEGKGLADTLHVQGNDKFHAVFRNPPQTTRAILAPAETAPPRVDLDLPAMPEEPYLSETAGQLGLRLWLDAPGDSGAAAETAAAWRNDRYVLIPDGEASSAVLWDIEVDSKESADLLQAAVLQRIAAMAGLQQVATPGQPVATPEKRHLKVSRPSPTRIRFVNSATIDLAGKFD